MISVPISSISRGVMALTVATVPTGMIDGRVDVAMGRVQQAKTRAGLLAGLEDFKRKLGCSH